MHPYIYSFIDSFPQDLLLLGLYCLNRIFGKSNRVLLGGTLIYIHQWHMSWVEATFEKSEIIPFIVFLACLGGSAEIMDSFLKDKDLIDCIFFQSTLDPDLFKNNGRFSFSFRLA